ncbi:MAG TPA: hypothetical protein VK533_03820, partial [Sphingomonas sp.]|uniref:hypothetical protein n=1 Tax=Sphingomonas sp. TaxID=28214 RepID=UPI002BDCAD59
MLPFLPPAQRGRNGLVSLAIVLLAAATLLLLWSRIAPASFVVALAALLLVGAAVAGALLLRVRAAPSAGPRDWPL